MGRSQNPIRFTTGQATVTISGTPVQLSDQVIPPGIIVILKARDTNTGRITIGNSSANALNTGTGYFSLLQSQAMAIQVQNMNAIWIDATVSGEGVEFFFER